MPLRPIIYGGKEGDNVSIEPAAEQDPVVAALGAVNQVLMAPVDLLLAFAKGSGIQAELNDAKARYTRSYMPQGGVKPTMTTAELNAKNIFGETGGN